MNISHVANDHNFSLAIVKKVAFVSVAISCVLVNKYLTGRTENILQLQSRSQWYKVIFALLPLAFYSPFSVKSEKEADLTAVKITGNSKGLSSALGKMKKLMEKHNYRIVVNMEKFLTNKYNPLSYAYQLFSTHPKIEKRQKYLKEYQDGLIQHTGKVVG